MRASVRRLLLLAIVSSAACGPTVDLTKGLEVTIVNSGWYDLGIVNGQTKLVPTVVFTLHNVSDQKLVTLQLANGQATSEVGLKAGLRRDIKRRRARN